MSNSHFDGKLTDPTLLSRNEKVKWSRFASLGPRLCERDSMSAAPVKDY